MPVHLLNTSTTNPECAVISWLSYLDQGSRHMTTVLTFGALLKTLARSGDRSHATTRRLGSTPRRIMGSSEGRELHRYSVHTH